MTIVMRCNAYDCLMTRSNGVDPLTPNIPADGLTVILHSAGDSYMLNIVMKLGELVTIYA